MIELLRHVTYKTLATTVVYSIVKLYSFKVSHTIYIAVFKAVSTTGFSMSIKSAHHVI